MGFLAFANKVMPNKFFLFGGDGKHRLSNCKPLANEDATVTTESKQRKSRTKKKRATKELPEATAALVAPTNYSLQDELNAFLAKFVDAKPQELIDIFVNKAEELAKAGIVERAVKEGDVAPCFDLTDAVTGERIRLFDLIRDGPVIVSFYRGEWCAYCNMELKALQEYLPKFEAKGAKLVAISPQIPDYTASTMKNNELSGFPVLSDVGCKVGMEYGLDFVLDEELRPLYTDLGIKIPVHNGDSTFRLPVPATYVIDTDGTVLYSFVETDFTKRAEPEEILQAIPYYGSDCSAW